MSPTRPAPHSIPRARTNSPFHTAERSSGRRALGRLMLALMVIGACALIGCSGEDDIDEPEPTARLISLGDADFLTLETPEQAGECESSLDCESSASASPYC